MADEKYDQMNAKQKEVDSANASGNNQMDTEFAADTWMGAVLNPDVSQSAQPRRTDLPEAETAPSQPAMVNDRNFANRRNNLDDLTRYEMGAEAAPLPTFEARSDERIKSRSPVTGPSEAGGDTAGGLGMVGLGLSLLSLFLLPYLLAPVGIVLGYLATRRKATTLGTWAMIVGAVAILGALIVYPYFIAR